MGKRQTPKVLHFLPLIHWIYWWVELEVLGTPLVASSEFLSYLREENLLTSKGKYEEDYTLEALEPNDRVCYINHENGPN